MCRNLFAFSSLGKTCAFLLISAAICCGQSPRDAWRHKPDDEGVIGGADLDKQVSDLSQGEQTQIWQAIEKDLRDPNLSVAEQKKILLNLDAGDIQLSLHGEKQLLVGANGESGFCAASGYCMRLCGATGNCSMWLFVRDRGALRLVVSEIATRIVVEKTRVKGMPDIAFRSHFNASESVFSVYRWTGTDYKPIDCYIADPVGVLSTCRDSSTVKQHRD